MPPRVKTAAPGVGAIAMIWKNADLTIGRYSDLLNTLKFRPDVKDIEAMMASMTTKQRDNKILGTNICETWFKVREPLEPKKDKVRPSHGRPVVDELGEDTYENKARSRRNLKLSSFDSLKPSSANERFT
jgi:hypothetical protein